MLKEQNIKFINKIIISGNRINILEQNNLNNFVKIIIGIPEIQNVCVDTTKFILTKHGVE